jgi:hypothetical protein
MLREFLVRIRDRSGNIAWNRRVQDCRAYRCGERCLVGSISRRDSSQLRDKRINSSGRTDRRIRRCGDTKAIRNSEAGADKFTELGCFAANERQLGSVQDIQG